MSDTDKSELFNGHSFSTAGGYDDSTCDKCGVGIKQVDTPCVSFPYIGSISDNRAVVDVEKLEAYIQALITQQCKDAVDAYHTEITDNEKKVWMYRSDLEKQCNQARIDEMEKTADGILPFEWSHPVPDMDGPMRVEADHVVHYMNKRQAELQAQAKETE